MQVDVGLHVDGLAVVVFGIAFVSHRLETEADVAPCQPIIWVFFDGFMVIGERSVVVAALAEDGAYAVEDKRTFGGIGQGVV